MLILPVTCTVLYMTLILPRHCLIYDLDSSPSLSYDLDSSPSLLPRHALSYIWPRFLLVMHCLVLHYLSLYMIAFNYCKILNPSYKAIHSFFHFFYLTFNIWHLNLRNGKRKQYQTSSDRIYSVSYHGYGLHKSFFQILQQNKKTNKKQKQKQKQPCTSNKNYTSRSTKTKISGAHCTIYDSCWDEREIKR